MCVGVRLPYGLNMEPWACELVDWCGWFYCCNNNHYFNQVIFIPWNLHLQKTYLMISIIRIKYLY
jgi:hypothetical protein